MVMKKKSLSSTNPYLQDKKAALQKRLRSLASSTAIETGDSVKKIEDKIIHLRSSPHRVSLA